MPSLQGPEAFTEYVRGPLHQEPLGQLEVAKDGVTRVVGVDRS